MKLAELLEEKSEAQAKFDSVVYKKGMYFYHESPEHWREFYKHGINTDSVFACVKKPSEWITGDKTRICFELPPRSYVHPDMMYDSVEELVEAYPNIVGAYVSINQPIPLKYILTIEEVTSKGAIVQYNID